MITGFPFSCTTLCTPVGGVEDGSSLFSACLFHSSSLFLLSNVGIRYFFLRHRTSNYSLLFHYQFPTLGVSKE